jgi:hypothetical protein
VCSSASPAMCHRQYAITHAHCASGGSDNDICMIPCQHSRQMCTFKSAAAWRHVSTGAQVCERAALCMYVSCRGADRHMYDVLGELAAAADGFRSALRACELFKARFDTKVLQAVVSVFRATSLARTLASCACARCARRRHHGTCALRVTALNILY